MAVEVNNLNYEEAHRYYLAFYTNTGSEDLQKMGEEVSKSPKWQPFITKWQSEDATIYDLDGGDDELSPAAKKEIDNLEEDGPENTDKSKARLGGGAAVGGVTALAGLGLALFCKTSLSSMTGNGSVIVAGIYAAVGVVYVVISEVIRAQAKQSRETQERYIAKAEKDMEYDFAAAQAKADDLHNIISFQNEQANKIMQEANANVGLTNAVASATADSNTQVSISALGQGDAVAGAALAEIEGINDEILNTIGEYDQIIAEVNNNKAIVDTIKNDLPEFKEQRANDKITEYLFAAGGAAGVIAGAMGIMASASNIIPVITAVAIVLFAAGIICFGAAAIMSFMEASKQQQGENNADEKLKQAKEVYSKASEASSHINECRTQSNLMYQDGLDMAGEMDKEDVNYNGPAV